jgi:TolA-binding protein
MIRSRTALAVVVAAALGLLGAQTAEAQLGKRKKTTIKKMGKHKRLSKAAALRMTAAKEITAADIRKSQAKLRKLAAKKESLIRRGIRLLESTLKLADSDSPKYPDYLFRVAEHYNAMRMNQWKTGMSMHDKVFQAQEAGNKAMARRLRKRQKLYFARAEYWLRKSLTKYVRITTKKRYSSYSRMDEVIFTVGDIAKSLAEQERKRGKHAKARGFSQIMMAMFSRLVKEHPQSRFIPDALLAKGEFFFNGRRMVEAIAVFQKVARYKKSPLAPYANYKIGWCYLNLKRFRFALSKFVEVSRGKRGGKNLIQAARKDVVRAYTHIGRPDKAYNFFHNVSQGRPPVSKMMFVLLGTMYYAQGKNIDCIKVFQEARRRWPRDKERCNWATTIVEGLKTNNRDTLDKTRYLYEEYIKTYPKSKVIYLMRYQYADLLWFFNKGNPNVPLHEWVKLAHVFTAIVKARKPRTMKQKEYVGKRNEAALAAVRCWMKANKITSKDISAMGSKTKSKKVCAKRKRRRCIEWTYIYPKQEISAAQLTMIEAFKTYIKYVPRSKYLPAIVFNTGHIFWKHNHFDMAIPLFLKVALKHVADMPNAARTAAFRIIGMLSVKKRYKDVRKYVDKFIASKKLKAQGHVGGRRPAPQDQEVRRLRRRLRGDGHALWQRLQPRHLFLERGRVLRGGRHAGPGGEDAPDHRAAVQEIEAPRPVHVQPGGELPQPGLLQAGRQEVRAVLRQVLQAQGGAGVPHVGHRAARWSRRGAQDDEERLGVHQALPAPGRQVQEAVRQVLLAGGQDVREPGRRGKGPDQPEPVLPGLWPRGRDGQAHRGPGQAGEHLVAAELQGDPDPRPVHPDPVLPAQGQKEEAEEDHLPRARQPQRAHGEALLRPCVAGLGQWPRSAEDQEKRSGTPGEDQQRPALRRPRQVHERGVPVRGLPPAEPPPQDGLQPPQSCQGAAVDQTVHQVAYRQDEEGRAAGG